MVTVIWKDEVIKIPPSSPFPNASSSLLFLTTFITPLSHSQHPKMKLLILFIFLTIATSSPSPDHQSHFTRTNLITTTPPQEQISATRPLPLSTLTPTCTLNVLTHIFNNTISLPPTNSSYSPPFNCTWSRAALHLSASSNGSQYDRIAAVWLSGIELLRTSTPEPTPDGVFWNVDKEITKYSYVLRQENATLSVMLENLVNDVYTGAYNVSLTFLFYDTNVVNESLSNGIIKSGIGSGFNLNSSSLELNDNPADLIVPISTSGDDGFWFRIERETDLVYQGVRIPLNTYRAVVEVYVSFHGNDEFWYSNPPDVYFEENGLEMKRGHGSYREVLVKVDDMEVGSVVPFPVIFTGGINPLFWEPVVSIGAFDLPSYEIELTPLLGMLLDNKTHYFGLGVGSAISYWLVDANLHLWLDGKVESVQAQVVKNEAPTIKIEREYEFQLLDGEFEVEVKKESEFSGWVNSSAGNFTTTVSNNLKFENDIEFKKNGTEKEVEQKVKLTKQVSIFANTGNLISKTEVKSKYPLKIKSTTFPGSAKDTYLMNTELENSMKEDKSENGVSTTSLENTQKSKGWMFVQDHDVISGSATTSQSYSVQDSYGCFSRKVTAAEGQITTDSTSVLCASAL